MATRFTGVNPRRTGTWLELVLPPGSFTPLTRTWVVDGTGPESVSTTRKPRLSRVAPVTLTPPAFKSV